MQTKTTMPHHSTRTMMTTIRVQLTSVGDTETLDPSYTAHGKGKPVLENSLLVPQKIKYRVNLCVCLLSCVWLFSTLWTVAHQAPLSMGFSRQEYSMASGLPCPLQGGAWGSPNSGIKPVSPVPLALAGKFFTTSNTWEAPRVNI